jgi:2-polyprenyl-3-methyl-5-hydroxy-6-metoxy-1,4-benzoquinol methylase
MPDVPDLPDVTDRFERQNAQYAFPYHHLPHLRRGRARTGRRLRWGVEYLCYQLHLAQRVQSVAPRSVLDVGCGDGRFLSLVGDAVPRRKGVDLSEGAIRFARAFVPDVEFDVANAADLDETFDVVTAVEVLEHVPDEAVPGFLRTLAERTRAGGMLLLSVPTTNVPLNKKHYRHYDRALLESQLAASGAPLVLEDVEYVYQQSRLERLVDRVTSNRFLTVESPALEWLLWQHAWNRLRVASASDGKHVVATLRRR